MSRVSQKRQARDLKPSQWFGYLAAFDGDAKVDDYPNEWSHNLVHSVQRSRRVKIWIAGAFILLAAAHSSLLSCSPLIAEVTEASGGVCVGGSAADCLAVGGAGGTPTSAGGHGGEVLCDGAAGAGAVETTLGYFASTNAEKTAMNCFKEVGEDLGAPLLALRTDKPRILDGSVSWDLAFVNGGSDVRALSRRESSNGQPIVPGLTPLDPLLPKDAAALLRYFPEILRPETCGKDEGPLYSLPVGIHRANVLFTNRDLVRQIVERAAIEAQGDDCGTIQAARDGFCLTGIEAPGCSFGPAPDCKTESGFRSVDELIRFLELSMTYPPKWSDACPDAPSRKPFVMAGGTWLPLLFFENLMVSHARLYEDVWRASALEATQSVPRLSCSDVDNLLFEFELLMRVTSLSSDWYEAVNDVARGCAVATAMGDWGTVALEGGELADSEGGQCDYIPPGRIVDAPAISIQAFPGTSGAFVFASDVVVTKVQLDADGPKACAANAWFGDVIGDPEVLGDYWRQKGSIPPLANVALKEPTPYQEDTYQAFQACREPTSGCRLLWAVSGVAHPTSAGGTGGEGGSSNAEMMGDCERAPLDDESSATSGVEDFLYRLWTDLRDCPVTKELSACNLVLDGTVAKTEDHIRRVLNDTIAAGPFCPASQ